jgi:predicted nucleotidyltransferase component of viral defense system
MTVEIIQQRLESYHCESVQEEENAIREIAQEVVLGGLSRAGFFKAAAFQGGTCLRIFFGSQRFSEDLDFILQEPEREFTLERYLNDVVLELKGYGFEFELTDRKRTQGAVKAGFLKDDSFARILTFEHLKPGRDTRSIKIKIEVDANPPKGSGFETKYHAFPFAYEVASQDLASLFASKSHALLCREYIKGRDWYDLVWYTSRKMTMNYEHLSAAIDQLGPWQGKHLKVDREWYLREMERRIRALDIEEAKNDVKRFVKAKELPSVELWSRDFFLDRLRKLSENL